MKNLDKKQHLYGFLLASMNIVTLIFWNAFNFQTGLKFKLEEASFNTWSFIPPIWTEVVSKNASFFVWFYILTTAIACVTYLVPNIKLSTKNLFLALALVAKLCIFVSSYDFMGNYHYMGNLITLGFIVTNGSLLFCQWMIAGFYFGAGLIKLNWEWISGSALLTQTFISGNLLIIACTYVIVLELILIFGLFSSSNKVRYAILIQLILFHLFSWHIVGFYYPNIMLLMISVFAIQKFTFSDFPKVDQPIKFALVSIYTVLFLFAQFYPKILNKNESLTAEGRIWSLNMLDAKSECIPSISFKKDNDWFYLDEPLDYAVRVRCDPFVYLNYAKHLCAGLQEQSQKSLRLNIIAKKTSDKEYRWIVRDIEACSEQIHYSVLKNSWIQDGPIVDSEVDTNTTRHQPDDFSRSWINPNINSTNSAIIRNITNTANINLPINSWIHLALKSSPISDDDNWYVGSDEGILFAFKNNNLIWKVHFPHSKYGIHSSPAIDDKNVYIGTYDGLLHKLDRKSGQRIWTKKLGNSIGASPIIWKSRIYIPVEHKNNKSQFYCLDQKTGKTIWSSSIVEGLTHSSVSLTSDQRFLISGSGVGEIVKVNIDDGSIHSQKFIDAKIISTPTIYKDLGFAVGTDGHVFAFTVSDLRLKWKRKHQIGTRTNIVLSTESHQGLVALEDGTYISFDLETGSEVWRQSFEYKPWSQPQKIIFKGTSAYLDQCRRQEVCIIQASNGKILWKQAINDDLKASIGITKDKLVLIHNDDTISFVSFQ